MKNYHQAGRILEITAPYDLESGQAIVINGLPGVAQGPALAGERVNISLTGVYRVKKAHWQAWKQGQRLIWRNNVRGFMPEGVTLQVDDVSDCGTFAWEAAEETAEYGLVRFGGLAGIVSKAGGTSNPPAPAQPPAPVPPPSP